MPFKKSAVFVGILEAETHASRPIPFENPRGEMPVGKAANPPKKSVFGVSYISDKGEVGTFSKYRSTTVRDSSPAAWSIFLQEV